MSPDRTLEVKRQIVHLLLGLSITATAFLLEPVYGKLIVAPLLAAVAVMLILPKIGGRLRIHDHLLYHFERPRDIEHFPYRGAILYGIGVTPALLLLDINTACAVIAILSVGDSMSTLIGKFYGRHRIGHKSLEGFIAFAFSSFFGALIFLPDDPGKVAVFAFLGGLLELSNIRHNHIMVDDNLIIPIGLTVIALIIQ